MKTKGFAIILALILSFSLVSAVEFNVNSQYSQGETIITRLSGNFLNPLTRDNILFYQGHVRIPVDWGMMNVQGDYYIYASLAGKPEGNYTVSIENVKYMKGADVSEDNIVRNFTITNKTADFSLNPGAVATAKDFSVEVQNLQDKELIISIDTASNNSGRDIIISSSENKQSSISLKSGEIKKINFRLGSGNSSIQYIHLSTSATSYKFPVYISESSTPSNPLVSVQKLEPSELILSIPTNATAKRTIYLYNTGIQEVKNITLSVTDELPAFVNLSVYHINSLGANSNIPIELSIFSLAEGEFEGMLKANVNDGNLLYSSIALKFLNDYVPPNITEASYSEKTCSELSGRTCSDAETCDAGTVYAKDNVCCLGNCKSAATSGSGKRWIAILILIVIAGGLYWFYMAKFKKAKKPVNLLDIAKGKD